MHLYFLQLVMGSAVMAFEEVCPDRIDLIHKNYRKLCNLLVDVEEWGQVIIMNMLTRYARTQFSDPNKHVSPFEYFSKSSSYHFLKVYSLIRIEKKLEYYIYE